MKKYQYFILGLILAVGGTAMAAVFNSAQLAPSASSGKFLQTNGSINSWATISTGGSGTISTSTVPTIGQIPYWTSNGYPSLLGSTATTSVTCTGTVSCIGFNVLGSSPITINGASGTSASSTLLSDSNTFTGVDKFTNASSDFSGTWQTHAPAYFQTALGFTPYNATNPSNFIALTALSGTYPILYNNSTGAISTALASSTLTASSPLTGSFAQVGTGGTLGIQVANTSQGGYLTNTDWNTFNGKQYAFSTSTLTASSPLTGSFIQVGSGGSLGCTTASSGVAGCLSSTAFDTFNNKQATIGVNYPITLSGATIGSNFGTTTTIGVGNDLMLYTNHTGVIIGTATSTLNIGGSAGTVTSISSHASTELSDTANIARLNAANAFTNAGTNSFVGNVGIGTTAPGLLGVTKELTLEAKTATNQVALNLSGYGTTNEAIGAFLQFYNNANRVAYIGSPRLAGADTSAGLVFVTANAGSLGERMRIDNTGNVGIGTTSPSEKLDINGNGRLENQGQLRFEGLRANGGAYASLSATSTMTSNVNWTLPQTDGTNGQVLSTNGVGNLYFGTLTSLNASTTLLSDSNTWTGTKNDFSGSALKSHTYASFAYSTSTAWTATTTIQISIAYTNEKWSGAKCVTDTGTLNADFYHTSSHLALLNASTTIGHFSWSANNSANADEIWYVDVGTPLSSPKKITCSIDKIVNN